MRRASKRDTNEPEIVAALEAMGATVTRIDNDEGFPDLVVGIRERNILMEVKLPGQPFKPRQKTWHGQWRGRAFVVHSVSEAIGIVKHVLSNPV